MSPPSTGTSSISSPPPTTSRLNVNSTAFTPPRPLKKADSTEVNIENLKPSSSLTSNTSTDVQVSVSRRGSPGTANPSGEEGVARAKAVEQFAKAEQLTEEPMVDTIRRDPGSLPQDIKGSPYTSKMEPKKRAVLLDQPNPSHAPVPLPSALATARNIDVLSRVQPNPALGANARDGKFQYRASSSLAPRQGSTAMSFDAPSAFSKSTTPNPFGSGRMGQFTTSGYGPARTNFGTRRQRGKQRDESSKISVQHLVNTHVPQKFGLGRVAPLKTTKYRWDRKAIQVDQDSPEMVDRKVRGLLNKLTMKRFDSISDQIIEWANKSEKEKDGRTLIQVIRLVFEKAINEAMWSEMYARLCRKMMELISDKVQDDGIRNPEGKPIAGGQLFRKYLLNRCQEDFERGWVAKETTATATASKGVEGEAAKASNKNDKKGGGTRGVILYSDEYYAAQEARRQGLGLIKFIGELFKLQMLTERIMHECVKKLLGNVNNPEEEETESLCMLLTTTGYLLDTQKARAHMDVYFQRMGELAKSVNVSPRMQLMLQDVIELRERKWGTRNGQEVAAPATAAQNHENVARKKATKDNLSIFGKIPLFESHFYLLLCLVSAAVAFLTLVIAFFGFRDA